MDGEAFADQLFEATQAHVEKALAPLLAEVAGLKEANSALEARLAEAEARPEARDGEPGRDAEPVGEEQIARAVAAYLAANPPEKGADGQNGVGLAGAMIDREGALVVTLSDGKAIPLGPVVGKDGAQGKPGFSLSSFDTQMGEDGRTLVLAFESGDIKEFHEITFPAVIYRGVWSEGKTYDRGDMVTWAGSVWHCDKDGQAGKPEGEGWTLAVKRGRDGKSEPVKL